jgi:chromosome segregation ATPase
MQQFSNRLENLKREFATGQARLARLDEDRANLRDTLLCIRGAIQVLEEELAKAKQDATSTGVETEIVEQAGAAGQL